MKQMLITGGTVSGGRYAAGYRVHSRSTCSRYLRAFPNQTAPEEEERK